MADKSRMGGTDDRSVFGERKGRNPYLILTVLSKENNSDGIQL